MFPSIKTVTSCCRRWRLFLLLFLLPTTMLLLLVSGAFIAGRMNSQVRVQSRSEWNGFIKRQARHYDLIDRRAALQRSELKRQLEAEEIDSDEWEAITRVANAQWSSERMAPLPFSYSPRENPMWRQMYSAIGMAFGVPLLFLFLLFWLLVAFFAKSLLKELRQKGYEQLTHVDALLLLLLRRRARTLPPAQDFLTIPGEEENVDSLIAFSRLRGTTNPREDG